MGKLKEKILFSRLQQKDKDAFAEIYDLYIDQIYRFVFFKVGNKEETEDLTSVIFLKTWNYLQENDSSKYTSIKPLIYKIARTSIIDHYRKRSSQSSVTINGDDSAFQIVDEKQNLAKQAEISSDLSLVGKKLAELKEEYREVIILRFIHELTIGEIAEILNKTRGNVRVQVFRATKALRELVNQED